MRTRQHVSGGGSDPLRSLQVLDSLRKGVADQVVGLLWGADSLGDGDADTHRTAPHQRLGRR
jgi:hypothetical protein